MRHSLQIVSVCMASVLGLFLASLQSVKGESPLIPHTGTGDRVSPYYLYGTYFMTIPIDFSSTRPAYLVCQRA